MAVPFHSFLRFALCLLLFAGASLARADAPPDQEAAMARTLFMQGTEAAKANDWARARDAFAASYALRPSVRTLFNLGIARLETGELVAAGEALRSFMHDADPGKESGNLAVARRELQRIEPLIAHVRVDAEHALAGDQLEVDGHLLPRGVIGTELPLDPGPHRIRWLRPEHVLAEQTIEVQPGERKSVELVESEGPLTPTPALANVAPPSAPVLPQAHLEPAPYLATQFLPPQAPEHDDSNKRMRRWLIGGGVAAVLVGAAVATFFLVRKDDKSGPDLVDSNVTNGVLRVP